jgi:hypothetical protein
MAYQLRNRKLIEQTNQKKRARVNSDLNEIHEFQSKIPYVDLKTIEDRLDISGFSLNEINHSCTTKFKNEIKSMNKNEIMNESFYIDIEKLQLKLIQQNIKKGNELKEYIDTFFQDLIYDLSLYYVNYELTYILHELNKIRNKIINNSLYNEEMIILTQSIKILIYYIFMKTIEQEREEKRKNESLHKKIKKNK